MKAWAVQPRLRFDIGWRDLLSILTRLRDGRETLDARIRAHAPPDLTAIPALSVRTIFDALLAETAAGRAVLMSGVNIDDMAGLAEAHGCEIRTLDIDLDTLAAEAPSPADLEDVALVLIAHLYGRRSPIPPCGTQTRAVIVEDCAQGFSGRLTLSPGCDVALYSFGPIKSPTALGGAVGVFRDRDLAERVAARVEDLPPRSETWFLRRAVRIALLKALSHPVLYGLLLRWFGRGGRDVDQVIGGLARGFPAGEDLRQTVAHGPPLRLLRLLDRRLRTWVARPSTASALVADIVGDMRVPGHAAPGRWWVAPVLHARPEALVRALRRRGWDATRGATSLRAIASTTGAPAATASRMMQEVVYVPLPVTTRQANALKRALDEALRDIE